MPGMSGFEVLRTLRADPRAARHPGRRRVGVQRARGARRRVGRAQADRRRRARRRARARRSSPAGSGCWWSRAPTCATGSSRRSTSWASSTSGRATRSGAARCAASASSRSRSSTPGMHDPEAAMAALDLRGRRLRRSVVAVLGRRRRRGLARLDAEPVPIGDAGATVLALLEADRGRGWRLVAGPDVIARSSTKSRCCRALERTQAAGEGAPARALRRGPARDVQAGARARPGAAPLLRRDGARARQRGRGARRLHRQARRARRGLRAGDRPRRRHGARRRPARSSSASCSTTSARSPSPTRSSSSPSR